MHFRKITHAHVVLWVVSVVAVVSPQASASVIGHLSVGNCPGGGVIVSLGQIDWALPVGPPNGCLQTGIGTTITSVGNGVIPTTGTINDLPPASGDIGFMTLGLYSFDLASVGGFGPGSAISCAVDPPNNSSCSIPGSPFILTLSNGDTSVSLKAHGTILDHGDGTTSTWVGSFTTQLNSLPNGQPPTPADIQSLILGGGSIQSTFSGEFDVSPIPEPASMMLMGGGLIALAAFRKRKRA